MSNTSGPSGQVPPSAKSAESDTQGDLSAFLSTVDAEPPEPSNPHKQATSALVLGAVGVVYGDIGTSPIYAFREAIKPVAGDTIQTAHVLGLLSLLIWTLILIVTIKYVFILLRADNRGEGGVLSLYMLARQAMGRRSLVVLGLGIAGAALFFCDAVITPAISVLSAVEGAGLVVPDLVPWVVPITLGILVALFAVQRQGTASIAYWFGPITALWFVVLGGIGLWHVIENPAVLAAFNPVWGVRFLWENPGLTAVVLGAVFLAVTGAEALYADLGHFGRRPIMIAWIILVFPGLVLNYLGQGALVLADPTMAADPFFNSVPASALPALVLLATAATVIASQAVITGAYSMTLSAIQLGLLPRMQINHTSHQQSGQIYIAAINGALLVGVVWLVIVFKTSGALASAYGIAVTGTMLVTTCLAIIYVARARILPLWATALIAGPIALIELAFLAGNLSKVLHGGYVTVIMALATAALMVSWWRGTQVIEAKSIQKSVPLDTVVQSLAKSDMAEVPGTAFYLTPSRKVAPTALLHSLQHFRALHEKVVFLTIETLRSPTALPEERVLLEVIDDRFTHLTLRYGFMETPNVAQGLAHARRAGLRFDVMTSTFFVGRRRPVVTARFGLGQLSDRVFAMLTRVAADPTDYFHLPRDRVVELGYRVSL